jgi:hypothetical protein
MQVHPQRAAMMAVSNAGEIRPIAKALGQLICTDMPTLNVTVRPVTGEEPIKCSVIQQPPTKKDTRWVRSLDALLNES